MPSSPFWRGFGVAMQMQALSSAEMWMLAPKHSDTCQPASHGSASLGNSVSYLCACSSDRPNWSGPLFLCGFRRRVTAYVPCMCCISRANEARLTWCSFNGWRLRSECPHCANIHSRTLDGYPCGAYCALVRMGL
ncbi:hypothetical protein B0T24DRAFT_256725 [Lasiosphaeria ovina]|uniref:Uncharacterized protein n=1 Tax=Lasiosphaeria ovina TaxID=92902 RepID=A0AAE0KBW1_9PEZI|nr:hypothetical protein B0T24DRAFT_256725 [Lasiosphaeria ovina]